MTTTSHAMDVDASQTPHPTTLSLPRASELPQTDHIVLDVDGRKFRTRKSTLEHCEYFSNQLSGRWPVDLLPDGSLPVEADPEVFPILLAYLRRPAVFPLLWTREKGFDYIMYNRLLAEADFFGLDELKEWITEKKFLAAVETGYKLQIHPGQFNRNGEAYGNHTWLNADLVPYQGLRTADVWGRDVGQDENPRPTEDTEVFTCFEAKIPSQGKFTECPCGEGHIDPEICVDYGVMSPEAIPSCEEIPTSIITVIKYTNYKPERCLRSYVGSEKQKP